MEISVLLVICIDNFAACEDNFSIDDVVAGKTSQGVKIGKTAC